MATSDPYENFKLAFEEQRLKIDSLYDRISKLEKANNEVVAFVKQNGVLPPILNWENNETEIELNQQNSCAQLESADVSESVVEDSSQTNIEEFISECSNTPNTKSCVEDPKHTVDLLSNIVQQQTSGLEKALQELGLNETIRDQLLQKIRSNVNNILTQHFGHSNTSTQTIGPAESVSIDINIPVRASSDAYVETSSCGDVSTDCSTLPISENTLSLSVNPAKRPYTAPECSDCSTPINPPTLSQGQTKTPRELQHRRRRELSRLNKRLTVSTDIQPDGYPSTPENPGVVNRPAVQCSSTGAIIPLSRVSPLKNEELSPSHNEVVNVGAGATAMIVESSDFLCPCGDRKTCPLSQVKQQRLANDVRTRNGFIRLVAVYRGRFIRQLLATHKVYDLIRTVKDSAKLALSIHFERQASNADSSTPLSNEELVLETRLLSQLRTALGQLHDIFFQWPLANQLSLLRWSRQRAKRVPRTLQGGDSQQHPESPRAESANNSRATDVPGSRLESDKVAKEPNVNAIESLVSKQESSGSYSLTKLIDSVRKSWPTEPMTERKRKVSFPIGSLTALARDNSPSPGLQLDRMCGNCSPARLIEAPSATELEAAFQLANKQKKTFPSLPLHPQPGRISLFRAHQLARNLVAQRQGNSVPPVVYQAAKPRRKQVYRIVRSSRRDSQDHPQHSPSSSRDRTTPGKDSRTVVNARCGSCRDLRISLLSESDRKQVYHSTPTLANEPSRNIINPHHPLATPQAIQWLLGLTRTNR